MEEVTNAEQLGGVQLRGVLQRGISVSRELNAEMKILRSESRTNLGQESMRNRRDSFYLTEVDPNAEKLEQEMKEKIKMAALARADEVDKYTEQLLQTLNESRQQNTEHLAKNNEYLSHITELMEAYNNEVQLRINAERDCEDLQADVQHLDTLLLQGSHSDASDATLQKVMAQFQVAMHQRDSALERVTALEEEVYTPFFLPVLVMMFVALCLSPFFCF